MQFLLYLPCWLGVCELAGEWNEWQCPLRGAQRRILIKCCLLPNLTNTASLQWWGGAFGSKALGFRHQTGKKGWSVTSRDGATFFFLYDRWPTEILGKCIGVYIYSVYIPCWWGCVVRFDFPYSVSERATVRVPTAKKGCVKKHSRKEQQQECIKNVCWWAVHGRWRRQ